MDNLVKAIAELFAAAFSAVGYVGKPRRRANIRDNLKLVNELAEHPDFGRGSWPHQALMNRTALEVAKLAGVPLKGREIPWFSLLLALVIGAPLAFWTLKLDQHGFHWYSIFPGAIAVAMGFSILGMLFASDQDGTPEGDAHLVIHPLAGDINATAQSPDTNGHREGISEAL